MKKYIFALMFLVLPAFAFAQESKVTGSGMISAGDTKNYKKIIVETSNGATVNITPKVVGNGTVSPTDLPTYTKVKTENAAGTKVEFKVTGSGTISPSEIPADYKKNILVSTKDTIRVDGDKVFVGTSEVKVMPEAAIMSANTKAGTTEVTSVKLTNSSKLNYEVSSEKPVKVLGFIKANMAVTSTVDAETGEVTKVITPWWKFLTF